MKYANYLVSLAKVEAMVWGIIKRLTEIGRCYGMEINVGEKKLGYQNLKATILNTDYCTSKTTGK